MPKNAEAEQTKAERENAAALQSDPHALAREDVVAAGGVQVESTELRPADLARQDNLTPPPAVEGDVVYGSCSMCRNSAPHSGPNNVQCPRCGLQPAYLQ